MSTRKWRCHNRTLYLFGGSVVFLAVLQYFVLLSSGDRRLHEPHTLIKELTSAESPANKMLYHKRLNNEFTFNQIAVSLRNTPYHGVENYTRYQVARLGLITLANVEALRPEFGPVINDVTSFQYLTTIPSCRDIPTDKRSVFVAIISAPRSFDKRELIRKTWFKHLQVAVGAGLLGPVSFAFVLGQTENKLIQVAIEKESKTYEDIIQIDTPDFYRNLSFKLIGLLNWVQRYCAKIDYVLKVNDDVYVNVYNLARFIQYKHNDSYNLFGSLPAISYPSRGELKVSYEQWPWKQYPTHVSGAAVLLPGKVIIPLLAACQTTPLMPFDDVYLFGLCTEKAGLTTGYSSSYIPTVDHKPITYDLHAKITWLTGSAKNMLNSFVATDDFCNNGTQCTTTGSNGMQRRVHSNVPFEFTFL